MCLITPNAHMNGSVSHGKTVKSAFLIIIMIIMTQVGYLDLINSPKTGNDSLSEETPVFETAQGTSIIYGNNTQWAPSGTLETYGFSNYADIIATSDDVILLKGQNGKDSNTRCIIAYNYVNKTSWMPNTVGTSQCPGANSYWKFIGIIDGVTLVRYGSTSSNTNYAIFGYNPSNDTFYSIASLPNTQDIAGGTAIIGRNVYMGTLQSDVTIFNYDNQTIWELNNIGSSSCNLGYYDTGAVGDKIFGRCSMRLAIFDPATQSLYTPSSMSSVYVNNSL